MAYVDIIGSVTGICVCVFLKLNFLILLHIIIYFCKKWTEFLSNFMLILEMCFFLSLLRWFEIIFFLFSTCNNFPNILRLECSTVLRRAFVPGKFRSHFVHVKIVNLCVTKTWNYYWY